MAVAIASDDVAAALASFFHSGAGPSHAVVSRALIAAGLNDGYEYKPGVLGRSKEQRVLQAFTRAQRDGGGRKLVEGLLAALRHDQLIGLPEDQRTHNEQRLRLALGRAGVEGLNVSVKQLVCECHPPIMADVTDDRDLRPR